MPRSIRDYVSQLLMRQSLKRRGVIIRHNTVIKNVEFRGEAKIEPYCRVSGDPLVVVGRNFYMNTLCQVLGEVTFGDDVLLGPNVTMWGRDHGIAPGKLIRTQETISEPIHVGNDVWIAGGCVILKGVTIGDGAVIGAGAVVNSDIPPNAIAVGVPARVVKYRGDP